jgi:hypothetical protein
MAFEPLANDVLGNLIALSYFGLVSGLERFDERLLARFDLTELLDIDSELLYPSANRSCGNSKGLCHGRD